METKTNKERMNDAQEQLLSLNGAVVTSVNFETVSGSGNISELRDRIGAVVTSVNFETVSGSETFKHTIDSRLRDGKLVFVIYPDYCMPTLLRNAVKEKEFPTAQMAADFISATHARYAAAISELANL